MKKHPIDDIFRDKLAGLERQPSSAAWDRLSQAKKNDESRLAAWVWYAAAGVAIAFMAGYSVWMNQSAEIKPQLANRQIPTVTPEDSAKSQVVEQYPVEQADVASKTSINDKETNVSGSKVPRVLERESAPVEKPVQLVTINEPAIVEQKSEIDIPTINPLHEVEAIQVASVEANPLKNENRTIVVRVEEPVVNEEKEKPSRFTRIFRQLKNAKQGETVDWDDVGFNPKALVARVDDRLRTGEEKVTEKYQNIKERTKL
jgi:hypothetical protein